MKYCYLQEGTAFKQVQDDYSPESGEIVVENILTQEELQVIFPNYENAFKKQNLRNEIESIKSDIDFYNKFKEDFKNNPRWTNLSQLLQEKFEELNSL